MQLLKWLTITDRYSRMYLDRELMKLKLNSGQYFYVLKICEEPGVTQDQLLSLVHVNASNVTRALAYLEKTEFIERKQNHKDRRTYHLYPTQKAKECYDEIQAIKKQWEDNFLDILTSKEQQQLEVLLKKLGHHAVAFMKEEKENVYE